MKEVLLNGVFADQVWLLGLHALGQRQIISYHLITHAHHCMGKNVRQYIRSIVLALNSMAFEGSFIASDHSTRPDSASS